MIGLIEKCGEDDDGPVLKLDLVEWKLKLREKNLVYKYLQISVLLPPYIKLRKYFAILMENLKFALL